MRGHAFGGVLPVIFLIHILTLINPLGKAKAFFGGVFDLLRLFIVPGLTYPENGEID